MINFNIISHIFRTIVACLLPRAAFAKTYTPGGEPQRKWEQDMRNQIRYVNWQVKRGIFYGLE